jgi:hypothetical protein
VYAPSPSQVEEWRKGNEKTEMYKKGAQDQKIIGYVSSGGFSYSRGCGYGTAYCSALAIYDLYTKFGNVPARKTKTSFFSALEAARSSAAKEGESDMKTKQEHPKEEECEEKIEKEVNEVKEERVLSAHRMFFFNKFTGNMLVFVRNPTSLSLSPSLLTLSLSHSS